MVLAIALAAMVLVKILTRLEQQFPPAEDAKVQEYVLDVMALELLPVNEFEPLIDEPFTTLLLTLQGIVQIHSRFVG